MIVPDLNLLLYAFNASAPHHDRARAWWESKVAGGEWIGISWLVLLGFMRLLTGRQLVKRPYSIAEIDRIISDWFAQPNVKLLPLTTRTYGILSELAATHRLSGSMITDACICATVIENRASLYSNDSDFLRFTEIAVLNPLAD